MILIINVCGEKLHYYEFVKPVEEIVGNDFVMKHYSKIKERDIEDADKIIICGTSLQDNKFADELKYFGWLKKTEKPVLGICAGMQIIGMIFGGKLKKKTEIEFYEEEFLPFLGLKEKEQVYHLHNYYVDGLKEFNIYSKSKIPQAIKHKTLPIYGVLFHPEVRQKEMVRRFVEE